MQGDESMQHSRQGPAPTKVGLTIRQFFRPHNQHVPSCQLAGGLCRQLDCSK